MGKPHVLVLVLVLGEAVLEILLETARDDGQQPGSRSTPRLLEQGHCRVEIAAAAKFQTSMTSPVA